MKSFPLNSIAVILILSFGFIIGLATAQTSCACEFVPGGAEVCLTEVSPGTCVSRACSDSYTCSEAGTFTCKVETLSLTYLVSGEIGVDQFPCQTVVNPNGQIIRLAEADIVVIETGSQEAVPTASDAVVRADLHLTVGETDCTLDWTLQALNTNFLGTVSKADMHNAPPGQTGANVFNMWQTSTTAPESIALANGEAVSGSGTMAKAACEQLMAGNVYTHIHTDLFIGEVRGQVSLSDPTVSMVVIETAAEEAIPNNSTAIVRADLTASVLKDSCQLGWKLQALNNNFIGAVSKADMHQAPPGQTGPNQFNMWLTSDTAPESIALGNGEVVTGEGPMTKAACNTMLGNGLYTHIHSTVFTGGEVRGQVEVKSPSYFVSLLETGDQEPAGVVTNAQVQANLTITVMETECLIEWSLQAVNNDFLGTVSKADMHNAPRGQTGPNVFNMWDTDVAAPESIALAAGEVVTGSGTMASAACNALLNGQVYTHIHTANPNHNGEVRAQIEFVNGLLDAKV